MLVSSGDALQELAGRLREAGTFGIDMEFERERTYWPKLQLIQVASKDVEAVVDPLAIEDLAPLYDLIADPSLTKVLHAGRQDAEIFHNESGRVPRAVYDTQIAAALVGLGEQVGYAALVQRLIEIHLKKHERITDWGRRPLREAQVEYALNDVRYLLPVKERLDRDVEAMQRASWLNEELAFYSDPEHYAVDPQKLFMKVSGWRTLNRRGMGILRELARWREEEAASRDVPKARVVPDDVLIEVALRKPKAVGDLSPLRRLHPRELERSGAGILAAVARGVDLPEDQLPKVHKARHEDPDEGLAADLLTVLLKMRAREQRIASSYLGNQKEISALVEWLSGSRNGDPPALARGWRAHLVGDELAALYAGKILLRVDSKGKVVGETV